MRVAIGGDSAGVTLVAALTEYPGQRYDFSNLTQPGLA